MSKLDEAIQVLKDEGYVEEDIAKIVTDWGKASFARLYSEMMLAFTDEEMQEFEKIEDKAKMEKEIKKRFTEKTKKNPDMLAREYLDIIVSEFLSAHLKQTIPASDKTS